MSVSSDDQLTGRVVSVEEARFGSRLTADAAIGATALHVEQTGDFDADNNGQVLVGGDLYDYTDVDEDALTITIDPPLTVASVVDDPVDIFDPEVGTIVVEYVAMVLLDDQDPDDEPIEVSINHALFDFLKEVIRGGPAENITLVPDGPDDWMIYQIDGKLADNLAVDVAVQQAGAAIDQAENALTVAQLAQAILDGEIDYYYTTSAPWANGSTAHDDDLGDVWVDTDSGGLAYRWLNRTWTLMADGGLVAALFAAQNAQTTADGKIVHFVGSSAPTAEGYGDIWTDTAHDNLKKYWDGDSWEPLVAGDDAIAAELVGKVLTGGLLRTAASGARLEITTGLLYWLNSGGGVVSTLAQNASGPVWTADALGYSIQFTSGGIALNGPVVAASVASGGDVTGDRLFASAYNDGVTTSTASIGPSGRVIRTPSTKRAKKNIRKLKPDPDAVLQLRPVTFQYRDAESFGKTRRPGLIAEELLELGLDEYVILDADGNPAGIHYAELVTALIPLLQRQEAKIADLQRRDAEKTQQIEHLTARLDALEGL